MFDRVSRRYDLANDLLSGGVARVWRIATTKAVDPQPGQRILDIAAGTGTSSAAFAARGAQVVAADFSEGMLDVGRQRHGDNPNITFQWADATDLPFDDHSFDAATISYGLRNVADTMAALREMRRVVKPGGRVVVAEFSTPHPVIRRPYRWYNANVLPKLAGFVGGDSEAYEYLNESIAAWPDQAALAAMMRDAGLTDVKYRNLTMGITAIHRGWVPTPAAHDAAAHTSAAVKKEPAE